MSEACYASNGMPVPCEGGFSSEGALDPFPDEQALWLTSAAATKDSDSPLDPQSMTNLTIAWTCTFALVFVVTLPAIVRALRRGKISLRPSFGLAQSDYEPVPIENAASAKARHVSASTPQPLGYASAIWHKLARATPSLSIGNGRRTSLPFSLGTLAVALVIPAVYLACLLPKSNLLVNPNRFGYLALASIPLLFILSSKNGPIGLLLGRSWVAVNWLHRWIGRIVVLFVLLHMIFWTIQYRPAGQVGYFLSQEKSVRGLLALAFLLLIAVSSIRPVRRFSYPIFFVLHYVGIVGFVVAINRHTTYASPWVTWVIAAIYIFDWSGRIASMRFRYVEVEPLPHGMTRVRVFGTKQGWRGGQHLSIRLFFLPPSCSIWSAFRAFEQHPFSIANATAEQGVIRSGSASEGLDLYIRSIGKRSWTSDLHETASQAAVIATAKQSSASSRLQMLALIEGPYGGISPFDTLEQESVLLVAGGSGMSFVLGVLDGIIGTRRRNGVSGHIDIVWAVRDKGHVAWFAEPLAKLLEAQPAAAQLTVRLTIYVTRDSTLTNLDARETASLGGNDPVSALPNTHTLYTRPSLGTIVNEAVQDALSPCGNCWPVCRCGEANGDGMCANDEEICMETFGPADARDLVIDDAGLSTEKAKEKASHDHDRDALADLPRLAPLAKQSRAGCSSKSASSTSGGCCSTPKAESSCGGATAPTTPAPAPTVRATGCRCGPSCCNGGCCCASRSASTAGRMQASGPVRVRTGGFAVVACGPGEMIAESRQAVSRIPIAKQARIGGVYFHEEHYSL